MGDLPMLRAIGLATVIGLALGCAHARSAPPAPAASTSPPPVYVPLNAPPDVPFGMSAQLMTLLEPCRRRALATWPGARRRFLAGLPPNYVLLVTTRLRNPGGRMEQVFVAVDGIDGTRVRGRITSEILVVVGYRQWQAVTVPERDIVDWTISRPDGSEEGNWMGKFIDAYRATARPPAGICDPEQTG